MKPVQKIYKLYISYFSCDSTPINNHFLSLNASTLQPIVYITDILHFPECFLARKNNYFEDVSTVSPDNFLLKW